MKIENRKKYLGTSLVVILSVLIPAGMMGCGKRAGELEILRTAKVKRGNLTVTISATGEVKPQNRLEVKPPIAGRVEEMLVREGEQVKHGQVMAWMSSTERAALLDAARAQGPEAVERWEKAYKPAPLIAPMDGTVIVRSVEPGQTVTTADPVVVVSDRLIVNAQVDETDLSLIKLGQKTQIRLDAYPDRVLEANVDHISYESTLLNNVNVYRVDILPGEVPPSFRSGMTADVTFIVSECPDALLVPSEAVTSRAKSSKSDEKRGSGGFVVYKKAVIGKPSPIAVKIGETDGSMTQILEGLNEGDEIVIVRRKQTPQGGNPFSATGNRPPANRS